jgi:Calcineurin-like phosphoesterase
MIAQLLNREFVLQMAAAARADLDRELKDRRAAGTRRGSVPDELDAIPDADLEGLLAGLDAIEEQPEELSGEGLWEDAPRRRGLPDEREQAPRPKDDFAFIPPDRVLSLVQSALEEYIETRRPEAVEDRPLLDDRRGDEAPAITDRQLKDVPLRLSADKRRLWGPFEVARPKILSDPRWALTVLAMGWRELTGRARFVDDPPVVSMADDVRIFLVGDWGSGLPRAQKVAEQIKRRLAQDDRREQHVIHLGDVYYSGFPSEYKRRFLNYWPVALRSDAGSFTLNGNHDMYSGGHGYFDTCLRDPRFARQKGCSFFALRNDRWQFLALDSSYEDGGLYGRQAEWAKELIDPSAGAMRNVLLSHHQLFSAHEEGAKVLGEKIRPVLDTGRIDGWFWGHEHRCIQYEESDQHGGRVGFASCVGHGGIPEYLSMKEGEKRPAPWAYEYLKQYGNGWEPWDTFGFAVLELSGPHMSVEYVDEDGKVHHRVTDVAKGKP